VRVCVYTCVCVCGCVGVPVCVCVLCVDINKRGEGEYMYDNHMSTCIHNSHMFHMSTYLHDPQTEEIGLKIITSAKISLIFIGVPV